MKDNYTIFFILAGTCIVIIIIIGVFYFMSANDTIQNQRKKKGYLGLLSAVSIILVPLALIFGYIGYNRRKIQLENIQTIKRIATTKKLKQPSLKV